MKGGLGSVKEILKSLNKEFEASLGRKLEERRKR